MAKLDDAEHARDQRAEELRKMGAHAVGVEPIGEDEDDYGVVAYFDEEPRDPLPKRLRIQRHGKSLDVELAAKIAPRFRLE